MTDTTLDRFIRLFRGRADAYGSEEGGCVKNRLDKSVFQRHLDGVEPIGVYPMVPHNGDWLCVWGCSDIDVEDYPGACRLAEALMAGGIVPFIEKSRSKGYHVWVFASKPVPARDMRRMLLAAHQVADYPAREVNPKQEHLNGQHYGNYVRLPYPNYRDMSKPNRRVLDASGSPMTLEAFLDLTEHNLADPETIARLASYYQPPAVVPTVVAHDSDETLPDAMKHLSPLGRVIWRDGPLPSRDRSSTLAKLGHECVRSGLNPSETRLVLVDADRRWGKYHLRINGEFEIDKLVQRVFQTT
jgi:hypothetical protein